MERKHNKALTPNAKKLRRNMTSQERKLWYEFLRSYPTRILRQKVIGRYIVDFYCAQAKLAIEIDGSQHYIEDKMECDEERTKFINACGIEVVRFSNRDIDNNFIGVCDYLDNVIRSR